MGCDLFLGSLCIYLKYIFLLFQSDLQDCPSFNDDVLNEIVSKWKGTCMARDDYRKSHLRRLFICFVIRCSICMISFVLCF
ncbi:hypothetical protein MKW92_002632 [Papaver armeniacum]|nr:hypothetical protein MKW92_002632 [Papaver armeniacum]